MMEGREGDSDKHRDISGAEARGSGHKARRTEHEGKPTGGEIFRARVGFRQPFDGTQDAVTSAEQDAVVRKFNSTISDTLLSHIDDVKGGNSDNAFLAVDIDPDNKIAVTVSRGEGADTMIHVQHEEGDKGGEHFNYTIDEAGSVVRSDSRDVPPVAYSYEEFKSKPWSKIEANLSNTRKNADLEEYMGYNNQPISLSEMEGVTELINLAEPRKDLDL
jgi:hypothetical protein